MSALRNFAPAAWKETLRENKSGDAKIPSKLYLPVPAGVVLDATGKAAAPVGKSAPGAGQLWFTMNEESPDRGKDVIYVDGYDLTDFPANPVMPWAHNYRGLPIGTWSEVHKTTNAGGVKSLVGLATFVAEDLYAFAWTAFRMYQAGILNMVSVGIRPIQWAWNEDRGRWAIDYLKQALLECSGVLIGQHQSATAIRSACVAAGIDFAPVVREAQVILDAYPGEGDDASVLRVSRGVLEAMALDPHARAFFDLAGEGGAVLWRTVRGETEPPAAKTEPPKTEPPAAKTEPGPGVFLAVTSCSVCGGEHGSVEVRPRKAGGGGYWGLCPEAGEPLFLEVRSASGRGEPENSEDVEEKGGDLDLLALLAEPGAMEQVLQGMDEKTDQAVTAVTGELVYPDETN